MIYEIKYEVTIYDVLVATMLPSQCYQLQSTKISQTKLSSWP